MSAIKGQTKTTHMPYAVRPLDEADVGQASEIERDAFPTLFPPTSFRRELKNRMARYLVAWRLDDPAHGESSAPQDHDTEGAGPQDTEQPLLSKLFRNARSIWPRRESVWQPGQQFIVGLVGIWYMVDEAHIVSVGVRSDYRGQGIGELLLIAATEQAMERRADRATLEVRVSNYIAQNLYKKYGFRERGIRKAYYTDNHEDALIMTTDPITTPEFRQHFSRLVKSHERRWGQSERILS